MAWSNSKYKKLGERYSDYRPEYKIWGAMIRRCTNPKCDMYRLYGGRGIKVCDRWTNKKKGFINFYNDMGKRPVDKSGKPYQIDRIDNNGDYCPENCRWVSLSENARNTRRNVYVYICNNRYCISEACKMFGINRSTVTEGVRLRGKSVTDAFANALERIKR